MTAEKAVALRQPFPPESVGKLPKGGVMLDYVGHAAVTDRLLTVDPNWSWEPFALGPDGLPAPDREGNLWIRLTICGVTRIGVGDGKNAKERIGDALRNAAMRFGVALDLWAKENLVEFRMAANRVANDEERQAERLPTTPKDDPFYTTAPTEGAPKRMPESPLLNTAGKLAKRMFALFGELGITEKPDRLLFVSDVVGREVGSSKEMTDADAELVVEALRAELDKQSAATGDIVDGVVSE